MLSKTITHKYITTDPNPIKIGGINILSFTYNTSSGTFKKNIPTRITKNSNLQKRPTRTKHQSGSKNKYQNDTNRIHILEKACNDVRKNTQIALNIIFEKIITIFVLI